jgi:PAS domain S-box-containing protein
MPNRLFEGLEDAADGAFVIDERLRIIFWNGVAETLLGFNDEEVIGDYCYRLLHGHNEKRNLICKLNCNVAKLAI